MTVTQAPISGGSFLLQETSPSALLTPDDLSEEHRMIRQTAERFMLERVMTNVEAIEHNNHDLMRTLLREAADLGLAGAEIPEDYGGMGLDLLSSMMITEEIARLGSFSVTFGGHAGIGTYPVLYFGNEEQKKEWLPKLSSCELISCYALTENHSGSDALAARTKAVLSEDGESWILNGSKMWITNGGFADVAMVFAKVDGTKFSCFIVPTSTPGFVQAAEEKKMGLKGSSTTALSLENVTVPKKNLVGEIGKGHKIALNVLNIGRFKLGAWCMAGSKFALDGAVTYAKERTQFGKPIAQFGAIRQKIAEMVVKTWVGDAMTYRVAGMIEQGLASADKSDSGVVLGAIEEYAAECAILKVTCSEYLDFIVDEMVQIYGGYGYSAEYPAERAYRDSRINRIFEGTNEINRLTITGTLLKRAMQGRLPLMDSLMEIQTELESGNLNGTVPEGAMAAEKATLLRAKKATLLCAGLAINVIGFENPEEKHQETLMAISDLVMEIFAMDSAWLRCRRLIDDRGEEKNALAIDVTRVFFNGAQTRQLARCRQLLVNVIEDAGELKNHLKAVDKLLGFTPMNTQEPLRRIATRTIDELGRYPG